MSAVVNSDVSVETRSFASTREALFDSDPSLVTSSGLGVAAIHKEIASQNHHSNKRVIFVNRYFYPDVSATSQMLYDLTSRLAQQGMHVSVVCSQQLYDDSQAKLAAHEVIKGVHVHRVRTTRFGRNRLIGRAFDYGSFYLTAVKKLLEIVQTGDIVVAKTDPPLISVAAAAVTQWRGAHLINWLQDLFPEVASHLGGSRLPKWVGAYLRRLRDQSLQVAHTNVVIGSRMKEQLLQRRIDEDKIQVIENWSDGDFVEPKPVSASQLRTDLGLQDKFVVGYSGNLGRAHEFETILQAATALRNEQDVVFLMIGGGVKMKLLQQAATARQLQNFKFLPYQPREQLADSLAAADVHLTCLLPALEGLIVPSKFYGILAAGRPSIVIGDPTGELGRIVLREKCGGVARIGDFDALVSEIWHMKLDAERRHRMGARARTLFVERYTANRGADRWLKVFEKLLSDTAVEQVPAIA